MRQTAQMDVCRSKLLISSLCLSCITLCIACVNFDQNVCYSDNVSKAHRLYGTKTTYSEARRLFRNESFSYQIANCKPVMFYLIARHAIRYPDAEDIAEMAHILPQLQLNITRAALLNATLLCDKDVNAIREWKFQMKDTDDNRISDTGILETKAIAKEFKTRYPSLLNVNKVELEIGITSKERTAQTADAFLQQIKLSDDESDESGYDSDESETEPQTQKEEKPFLYFHDTCEQLLELQGVKLVKPKVVKDIQNGKLMRTLLEKVNQRFGFDAHNSIDAKKLKHVVRACHFEYAIFGHSVWCSAFTDDELKLLEYLDDIEDFYEDAYGRKINSMQTCPLIGDLINKVQLSVSDSKQKRTYLHFTHAGVIKRLFAGFGLFDDLNSGVSINADHNFCLSDNRKWKSSLISPFSANFVAVLYKCKDKDKNKSKERGDSKMSKFKIVTLVQESPVIVKGCDSEICSVDNFINTYKTALNCNLNEICMI